MSAQLSPITLLLKISTQISPPAKHHGFKRGSEEVPSTVTIMLGRSQLGEKSLLLTLLLSPGSMRVKITFSPITFSLRISYRIRVLVLPRQTFYNFSYLPIHSTIFTFLLSYCDIYKDLILMRCFTGSEALSVSQQPHDISHFPAHTVAPIKHRSPEHAVHASRPIWKCGLARHRRLTRETRLKVPEIRTRDPIAGITDTHANVGIAISSKLCVHLRDFRPMVVPRPFTIATFAAVMLSCSSQVHESEACASSVSVYLQRTRTSLDVMRVATLYVQLAD
jgi:hypothetical protein